MADRELIIKFKVDTTEADAASDAFWAREAQRQQQASQRQQQAGGAGGQAGGPAPAPVSATGVLPGNAPGLQPIGIGNAAAGGTLPGMVLPIPAAAAMGQIGQAGGPGAAAALPSPTGGGISIPPAAMQALPGPGGGGGVQVAQSGPWQVMAPGPGGGIPVTPTPVATPQAPPAPGSTAAQRAGVGVGAAMGLGAIRTGVESAMQSQAEGNEYVRGLMPEMEDERRKNREIAALRGLPNTAATAAQLQREAAGAGISADQWRDFQVGYQAYAGQYVGTGPDHKIDPEQSQRLQQQVAAFAIGSRGWQGADASRLLGTVISKSKKGASDEEILGQYSQMAQVMQLAPGYTGPLLGQVSEVVGETVGPNGEFSDALDAAILTRGVSERNPRTASAYSRAVMRGLRRARANPELSKELGLTKGMDTFEQLEAIQKAADAAKARGEDEGRFLETHGFSEIRQYGGIRTALDSGLRGGGFARARAEAMADAPGGRAEMARRLREESRMYAGTEEGGAQGQQAEIAAARREQAGRYTELERYRRRAQLAREQSGEAARGEGLGGILTQSGRIWGMGDREEQEIRSESTRMIYEGLKTSPQGRRYLQSQIPAMMGPGTTSVESQLRRGRLVSDQVAGDAANELKKIRDELAKQTKIMEQDPGYRARHGMAPLGPAAAVTVQQPGAGDGR